MFASVALASLQVAIDRPYDYRIPDSLQDGVVPGTRVFVPFGSGNRVTEAFVLALSEESGYPDCKEILRVADEKPLLGREHAARLLHARALFLHRLSGAAHHAPGRLLAG